MIRNVSWIKTGLVALFALLLAAPVLFAPLFDDAYIHARLAERLLSTGVPAFNPGIDIKTDSSTAYLLLLGAITALTGNAVIAIRVIQFVTVALFVGQLWRLASALKQGDDARYLVLFACALPPVLWAAYGGMETSLAALLIVSCALSSIRGKQETALLYVSMAACVRVELVVLVALFVGRGLSQGGRLASVWPRLAPVALCAAFDLAQYGTLLPHAAQAKSLVYDLPLREAATLAVTVGFEQELYLVGGLYLATLALAFYPRAASRGSSRDLFLLQTVVLVVAWSLGRSIMFPWYVATFAVCISVVALSTLRPPSEPRGRGLVARAFSLAVTMLSLVLGVFSARTAWVDLGLARDEVASGARAERYVSLAGPLYEHCPTCSLAAPEIGGLGYAFGGRVFDALGLGDADALRFHPMPVPAERASHRIGAIPPGYIAHRDPDYVVSMPVFSEAFRRSNAARAYLTYDCPLIPEHPERRLWGDSIIQVFAKEPLPAPLLSRMQCTVLSNDPMALDSPR